MTDVSWIFKKSYHEIMLSSYLDRYRVGKFFSIVNNFWVVLCSDQYCISSDCKYFYDFTYSNETWLCYSKLQNIFLWISDENYLSYHWWSIRSIHVNKWSQLITVRKLSRQLFFFGTFNKYYCIIRFKENDNKQHGD